MTNPVTDKNWWLIPAIVIPIGITIFVFATKKPKPFNYDPNLSGSDKIKAWINWMSPIAKKIGRKNKLPWQALVAQTGWETGWGKSELASKAFNFAGIKATSTQPYVLALTHEYENGVKVYKNAKFRKFNTLQDGLDGYAKMFTENKNFQKALAFPNDPYAFIASIQSGPKKWATSPNYVSNLHGILDNYFT